MVEHEGPVSHKLFVGLFTVRALSVLDWVCKPVVKLWQGSQVIRTDKVNHAPVLFQVVLQRVACQHAAPFSLDRFQCFRNRSIFVFDPVTFVANHYVRAGVDQDLVTDFVQRVEFVFSFQINNVLLSFWPPSLSFTLLPFVGRLG